MPWNLNIFALLRVERGQKCNAAKKYEAYSTLNVKIKIFLKSLRTCFLNSWPCILMCTNVLAQRLNLCTNVHKDQTCLQIYIKIKLLCTEKVKPYCFMYMSHRLYRKSRGITWTIPFIKFFIRVYFIVFWQRHVQTYINRNIHE